MVLAASSRVMPPSMSSATLKRIWMSMSRPTRSRMASSTILGKRARFSQEPPNSSSRRLPTGEKKLPSSQL